VSDRFFAGVDVNAHSFTAGADYGIHAATLTGFRGNSTDTSIDIVASGGTTMLEAGDKDGATGSVSNIAGTVLAVTAKNDACAIGIGGRDAIVAIVDVDRERGAAEWNVIAGIGEFTGSFIITL
jgi:hypothetical protein